MNKSPEGFPSGDRPESLTTFYVAPGPAKEPAEPWFWPVFGVLLALFVLPLWVTDVVPGVDTPAHLAVVTTLHRLRDPASHFHGLFMPRPGLMPYILYYRLLDVLGYLMPIDVANKVVTSAYVAGFPLSLLLLGRAFGRSRWLALLTLPLSYNFIYYLGFMPYCIGITICVATLGVYAKGLQPSPSRATVAGMILLPLLTLMSHAQPFAFLVCGVAVCIALLPGRRLLGMAAIAPSIAAFVWWSIKISKSGGKFSHWEVLKAPLLHRMEKFGMYLTAGFRDPFDWDLLRLFISILGAAAVFWLVLRIRGRRPAVTRPFAARLVLFGIMGGALVGYLFTPWALMNYPAGHLFIYQRFGMLAAGLIVICVPLAAGEFPRVLRVFLVVSCVVHGSYLVWRYHAFGEELRGFRALAEKMEADTCVAHLRPDMRSDVLRHTWNFTHFSQYLTVWRGAIPGFPFAASFQIPVGVKRKDGRAATWSGDAPDYPWVTPELEPHLVRDGTFFEKYGGFYRYFMMPRDADVIALFGADDAVKLHLVGFGGPFSLWENPAGTCKLP